MGGRVRLKTDPYDIYKSDEPFNNTLIRIFTPAHATSHANMILSIYVSNKTVTHMLIQIPDFSHGGRDDMILCSAFKSLSIYPVKPDMNLALFSHKQYVFPVSYTHLTLPTTPYV